LLAGVDPPNSALGTLLGPPLFALAWAIGVLVAGARAWKRDRRWMVNVVTLFGAIDLYERNGSSASAHRRRACCSQGSPRSGLRWH